MDFIVTVTLSIFIFIFGASIGSFLGVIVDRLMTEEGLGGRSHCHFCGKTLSWKQLVPVFSYISQGGRSVCCSKKLPQQYVFIEILTGVAFVFAYSRMQPDPVQLVAMWAILSSFIVILFADLKYHIIPDYATAVVVLVSGFLTYLDAALLEHLRAGITLFGLMFVLFAVTRGKGLGFGDVKFGFAMGTVLGLWDGLLALYLSFIFGGVVGLFLLLIQGKSLKSAIAFGPFLVAGTILMLFQGQRVWEIVHRLF